MITIQTADNALKTFYLDAVTEALDMKANPFLAQIQHSTANVVGKDVKLHVKYGLNGGIGAGSETGDLPTARGQNGVTFTATLKNLYGTIEISDKAIRASANNEGAFVNLLNNEMESLVKSASFNFGRMLYGDGTGILAIVEDAREGNQIYLTSVKSIIEGMALDFSDERGDIIPAISGRRVVFVDRVERIVYLEGSEICDDVALGGRVYLSGSKDYELSGLGALFGESDLYGVDRESVPALKPYVKNGIGNISETILQTALDDIEENSGNRANFIVCSWGVRRALLNYCRDNNIMLPTVECEGGFKALSYNGIPIVADRFCPAGTMYLLNTDDFKLHQLCDWKWLEGEDGKILKQIAGKPVYTATLVKYAELICSKPNGQGMLTDICEV